MPSWAPRLRHFSAAASQPTSSAFSSGAFADEAGEGAGKGVAGAGRIDRGDVQRRRTRAGIAGRERKGSLCAGGDDAGQLAGFRQQGRSGFETGRREPKRERRILRLMLVGDQKVRRLQKIADHVARHLLRHRRQIPDDAARCGPGPARHLQRLRERHLHLQQQDRVSGQVRCGHVCGAGRAIGAARDGDRVLARAVDRDEGATGRLTAANDQAGIDAIGRKVPDRIVTEPVLAHPARHRDLAFRALAATCDARGSDRLVGPLAAEMGFIGRRQHGAAGAGDDRHACDQIDIERAEDQDHGLH
jgi:hypothetical protein